MKHKMKNKILVCYTFCFLPLVLQAQVVTQQVHFDIYQSAGNNDFANNFYNGNGLVQLQTNGITGGCLDTPDSVNWGNDNAIYCSRYHPNTGDTIQASICFKFDATTINTSNFDRAVSIWFLPNADFNHYIIGTINFNQRMELITYSWTNNPGPIASLQSNHWYRYILSAALIGGVNHQVSINSAIYDLGLTGTFPPIPVNNSSGVINDSMFVADTSIYVSITGAAFGGAKYLDDFEFFGRKGVSNCITSSIADLLAKENIRVYPVPARDFINVDIQSGEGNNFEISLFNYAGQEVLQKKVIDEHVSLNLKEIESGIYLLRCSQNGNYINRKIVVSN